MSCCCCCKSRKEGKDFRTKEYLREVVRLGGLGDLYERSTISETQGGDDQISVANYDELDIRGKVPILHIWVDQSLAEIRGADKERLINSCSSRIRDIANVELIAITAEVIFIGPLDVAHDDAISELRKVVRELSGGIVLPDFKYFFVEQLDIRLLRDPEAAESEHGVTEPLLGKRESETSGSCCCCFRTRVSEPFTFNAREKSEFGWFYAALANENEQETLRKSVAKMYFASENLSQEDLEHVVEFYIDFYLDSFTDAQEEPDSDVKDKFRSELTSLIKKHYGESYEIGMEDTIIWFTHQMPRHYVRRCTSFLPKSCSKSCPSCVIS